MNYLLLISAIFSLAANASDDCNHLLSNRIDSAIQNLAKLRFDLDIQLAQGDSNILTRAMTVAFEHKRLEVLKVGELKGLTSSILDQKLKEQIVKVQSGAVTDAQQLDLLRTQQKSIQLTGISDAGALVEERTYPGVCAVSDHEVLIAGGSKIGSTRHLTSIELYDLKTSKSQVIGHLSAEKYDLKLTRLADGSVLAWGGRKSNGLNDDSVELIDLQLKTVTVLDSRFRSERSSYLLPSGKVFQFRDKGFKVFDRDIGIVSDHDLANLMNVKQGYTHSQQPNGDVVMVAFTSNSDEKSNTAVIRVDAQTLQSSAKGQLDQPLMMQAQVSLNDHQVLISGGMSQGKTLSRIAVYDLDTGETQTVGALSAWRYEHKMVLLPNRQVLILGGYGPPMGGGSTESSRAEIFDLDTGETEVIGLTQASGTDFTVTYTPEGVVLVGIVQPTLDLIKIGVK